MNTQDTMITVEVTLAFKKILPDSKVASKLIGWKTNSRYNHVEVILNNHWVSSSFEEGVYRKPLHKLNDKYEYKRLDITITQAHYNMVLNWIDEQVGKNYDRTGIMFAQLFPFNLDNRNAWFCSELVTKILQLLLVKEVIDLYPYLSNPGTLAKKFNLE